MDKERRQRQIQLLRDTMIRQEYVFKQQVRELHRLHQKQKALMEQSSKNRGVTRDFLRSLGSAGGNGRVKRLKTLDLEQLPDENDEEAVYVPHVTRAENSALDLREMFCEEAYQHWDCEAASPGDSQTLSLFPIPSTSSASAFSGPDCDLRRRIRYCQPFDQQDHWQPTRPSLGDDARTLIGQLVGEKLVKPTKFPSDHKFIAFKAPPLFFPASTSSGFQVDTSHTDSATKSTSDVVNPTRPPVQPVFHSDSASKHDKAVDVSPAALPLRSSISGVEKSPSNTVGRSFLGGGTTSCTHRTITPIPTALSAVDLNKEPGNEDPDDRSIIGSSKDTATWAATILLSLSPENCKLDLDLDTASRQVKATSNLLSSDVKLFKSVVIMLKQQPGKASRKLLVKGAACDNQGKVAAATLLGTLKEGKIDVRSQERPNNKSVVFSNGNSKASGCGKSFTARQSACNWKLWGDVTRRKRTLQRHRSNHLQPVRCFN